MEVFNYVDGLVEELMNLRGYNREQAQIYALYMIGYSAVNSVTVMSEVEAQMKSIRTDVAIKKAKEKN
jgi:Holliday junction resolvasome RuvABC DNA-binding subunit